MLVRQTLVTLIFGWCLSSLAYAADASGVSEAPNLPFFALNPPVTSTEPSPWSGLHIGSEVFAVSGGKGVKGGFGGAMDIGYNHAFANNLVVGVDAAIGYAPSIYRGTRYSGFDTAAVNLKIGYDMGRLMPYVTTGVVLEKPHTSPGIGYTGGSDSINGLFAGSEPLKAAGTVGAGFDYAVTDKLSVGVGVSVSRGPGFIEPGLIGR